MGMADMEQKSSQGLDENRSISRSSSSSSSLDLASSFSSSTTSLEVEQVRCKCCGLAEECTPAYIASVREAHFGLWVCGLCVEAVKEEVDRRRATLNDSNNDKNDKNNADGIEDAIQAHMEFLLEKRRSPASSLGDAMRRILRRSLDVEDGNNGNSHSVPSSPRRPSISHSSTCIGTIS